MYDLDQARAIDQTPVLYGANSDGTCRPSATDGGLPGRVGSGTLSPLMPCRRRQLLEEVLDDNRLQLVVNNYY